MGTEISIVATRSGRELAQQLARELDAPFAALPTQRLENEHLLCPAAGLAVAGRDVFLVAGSGSPVSENLLELLFGLRALRAEGARRLTAVAPYLPYARSERPETPGAAVPARQVAEWIEAAGADRLISVDLHAPQIAGFFRIPVVDLSAASALVAAVQRWARGPLVVASPDLGGAKRAAAFAEALGAPLVLIRKRREAGRALARELIGEVAGKNVAIVDDEIATGGTILQATELLVRQGATSVAVVATHGIFAGDALARLEASLLSRIVVTDTFPRRSSPRLETLPVAPILAAGIREGARAGG
jgi:ribose-phosphate pyrophosphokinase